MPTRESILSTLAEAREHLFAHYRAFTPQELEVVCTQSEDPDGAPWRPKDHLAHLTLVERAFQRMIKRTLKGVADPVGFNRLGATKREEILAWIHHNNQEYVEAHRQDTIDTLLTDLAHARSETLTLLDQLTDEQLLLPVAGAPWADGTIGGILITNAHHEKMHLSWVEEGLHTSS
jgi:hypothetical protein